MRMSRKVFRAEKQAVAKFQNLERAQEAEGTNCRNKQQKHRQLGLRDKNDHSVTTAPVTYRDTRSLR